MGSGAAAEDREEPKEVLISFVLRTHYEVAHILNGETSSCSQLPGSDPRERGAAGAGAGAGAEVDIGETGKRGVAAVGR